MELSFKNKIISIALKLVVAISATIGVILSAIAGEKSFMGGSTVFMYFTIQSNILAGVVCLIGIYFVLNNKMTRIWEIIKLATTVAITLTGVVFTVVLAPTLGSNAWGLSNVLTHVIVPLASIVDFFFISRLVNYKKLDVLYVLIAPVLYVIYAGIGYASNWKFALDANYPYFFLNWGSEAGAFGFSSKLPYIGVVWWILVLLLFLVGVALLFIKLSKIIAKRKEA